MSKVGRPRVGSLGVMVKVPPGDLALLDEWIEEQKKFPKRAHFVSRGEAIRWLVRIGIEQGFYPALSATPVQKRR